MYTFFDDACKFLWLLTKKTGGKGIGWNEGAIIAEFIKQLLEGKGDSIDPWHAVFGSQLKPT